MYSVINLEKVKEILLDFEGRKAYETLALLEILSNYGITASSSINVPDDISQKPEDVFIRCLASGYQSKDIANFPKLLDSLANINSPLISYLVARHSDTEEQTLLKIALSDNITPETLEMIATNSKDFNTLEQVYNNENLKSKLPILNNPYFKDNPNSIPYYLDSFNTLDDVEFSNIDKKNIPIEIIKEYYISQRRHFLHSYLEELTQTYEAYKQDGSPKIIEQIENELNSIKQEYEDILQQDSIKM